MKYDCTTRKGFTLIELLVVIAIIAILATILMPSLTKAKQMARSVGCQSNLKNLGPSIYMYYQDYNNVLPRHDFNGDITTYTNYETEAVDTAIRSETWMGKLMDHVGRDEIGGLFNCPAFDQGPRYGYGIHTDYSINTCYGYGWPIDMSDTNTPFCTANRHPSEILYITDSPSRQLKITTDVSWHLNRPHLERKSNVLCLDLHVKANTDCYEFLNGDDGPAYPLGIFPYGAN